MAAIACSAFHLNLATASYLQQATLVPTKRRSPVRRSHSDDYSKKLLLQVFKVCSNKKKITCRTVMKTKESLSSSSPGLFLLSSICTKAQQQKMQKITEAAATLLAIKRGEMIQGRVRTKRALASTKRTAAPETAPPVGSSGTFPVSALKVERPRLILRICIKTMTASLKQA